MIGYLVVKIVNKDHFLSIKLKNYNKYIIQTNKKSNKSHILYLFYNFSSKT